MPRTEKIPHWKTLQRKHVADGRFFQFIRELREEEGSNKQAEFDLIETRDWANIIAITTDREIVLIEQFRQGSGRVEIEIPGGIVDEGEEPGEAVLRELKEETGFIPTPKSTFKHLGTVRPNPAFLNNHCYTSLVTEVEFSEEPTFDETENISVKLLPLNQLEEFTSTGAIGHALVLAAFHWYKLSEG